MVCRHTYTITLKDKYLLCPRNTLYCLWSHRLSYVTVKATHSSLGFVSSRTIYKDASRRTVNMHVCVWAHLHIGWFYPVGRSSRKELSWVQSVYSACSELLSSLAVWTQIINTLKGWSQIKNTYFSSMPQYHLSYYSITILFWCEWKKFNSGPLLKIFLYSLWNSWPGYSRQHTDLKLH